MEEKKKRSLEAAVGVEGRRKVPNKMFVSFSKRRSGLFKKARDLCTKCDAQIAVLVLSPTGNPYAFGHSSVDDVLRRFLGQTTPTRCRFLTDEHLRQREQVEGLKSRIKRLGQNPESKVKAWIEREWEACTTLEELEVLKEKYSALLHNIKNRLSFSRQGRDVGAGGAGKMSFAPVEWHSPGQIPFNPARLNGLAAVDLPYDMPYSERKFGTNFAASGTDSSSFFGDSIRKEGHTASFPHIGVHNICPIDLTDSTNGMSYSVEKFGTGCGSSVVPFSGGFSGHYPDVLNDERSLATQNDMSLMQYYDTDIGSSCGGVGVSDDQVFDCLDCLSFESLS